MGLFDFFSGKPKGAGALKKNAARVANKRGQSSERWEAIRALGQMQTEEAIEALMVRFTFRADPSITDQEEKELAFQAILGAGDVAIVPVRAAMQSMETIAWPLKILQELVSESAVTDTLLALIGDMDTEYERDPQKKKDILHALEARRDPRIAVEASRFLDDVNEDCRFYAIGALMHQDNAQDTYRDNIREAFVQEESVRVRARILDVAIAQAWTFANANNPDTLKAIKTHLPNGYSISAKGVPSK